jgi:D-amino-acid dehydrogenase
MSSIGGPYILAFGRRVVTGATHEDVGFDYRVTAGGLAGLLTQALHVAPGLANASWIETRIGFRPMSPDRLPVIGPIPGIDGAFVATGLGAHGLTLGPAAGTIAARLAFGLEPGLDVGPLSLERFETSPEVPADIKNS